MVQYQYPAVIGYQRPSTHAEPIIFNRKDVPMAAKFCPETHYGAHRVEIRCFGNCATKKVFHNISEIDDHLSMVHNINY